MKENYNDKFKVITSSLKFEKPKLFLHSCCGPCSTYVIKKVNKYFNVTIYYYNPNIYPTKEYNKRKQNQIKLCNALNIDFIEGDYNYSEFDKNLKVLAKEKEGGTRCEICIYNRLLRTAIIAKEYEYDYFGTTLTVSPHKNSQLINKLGAKIENSVGIRFLYSDFKKENGYLESIELAKKYELYRQNYCGCKYSIRKIENGDENGKTTD